MPSEEPGGAAEPVAILMAKAPRPGRVKTRLVDAEISEQAAAAIAEALLICVAQRLREHFTPLVVLAVSPEEFVDAFGPNGSWRQRIGMRPHAVLPQGQGSLGERMERVWRAVVAQFDAEHEEETKNQHAPPVAFFGIDSPDVPVDVLQGYREALRAAASPAGGSDLFVGPTDDGGYWTLGAPRRRPEILEDIEWGSERVFAQTEQRAAALDLSLSILPAWFDIDERADLEALRRRIEKTSDEHLTQLRIAIERIIGW